MQQKREGIFNSGAEARRRSTSLQMSAVYVLQSIYHKIISSVQVMY